VSEWSDNLVGPVLANLIEGLSIGLVLEVSTCQKQMIEVPQAGYCGIPNGYGGTPTSDSGYMVVVVCMYNDMTWVYVEVEVSTQER
jgi:hypothetical protein